MTTGFNHFGTQGLLMTFAELGRAPHHRRLTGRLLSFLLLVVLTPASPLAVDNPIVLENQQPGSSNWNGAREVVGPPSVSCAAEAD